MIKLVLIDIDGTLVRDDKTLPDENVDAIKEALKNGVVVTLVTGRNYGSTKTIIDTLHLDVPVVLQNGAFIFKPYSGEILRKVGLSRRIAKNIIDLSRSQDVFYILYKDFFDDKDMLIDTDYVGPFESYLKHNEMRLQKVNNVLDFIDSEVAEVALLGDEDKILHVIDAMDCEKECSVIKSLTRQDEAFYEFFGPKVGKGEALNYLCQHFNVKPEEIMFLGDAYNDMDLMSLVGMPVAMGNAVEELKRMAKAVTKGNNDAGVAWAIKQYVLKNM